MTSLRAPGFGPSCQRPALAAADGLCGAAGGNGWAELVRTDNGWGEWALEARVVGDTVVNDRSSDKAAGHGVAGRRWGRTIVPEAAGPRVELLARVDNLFDRAHAGPVIANEAGGRFFETGAPSSALLAPRWVIPSDDDGA